ncbi:MAG: hypothetical protein L0K07_01015 [Yaniella sp.]|uniref:YciI family protein n=1 Tax=Yaniella sp. TaxID=2773929 RepID=UPI0026474A7D|nr:hypothetical protein [Yaniella sp.]MDN5815650.1 hypothetical protein [Yaniella sp.]MDN5838803.1 hypothetical protein [Yaniella sp.]MDN6358499.1 hypothetical protein [Yaniella sp.]MDN6409967.1 hypothetical protein [Yaniella sp.]MDN6455552.1 hypothetical protein [Yaniella sp.]
MPTFIVIGYGDRNGYDKTTPSVKDMAHKHDTYLRDSGAVMGVVGTPIQVRNHDAAQVVTTEGPFQQSELPVAGFTVLEAATIDEAVRLASKTPCAVAQGVVEVWPLQLTA